MRHENAPCTDHFHILYFEEWLEGVRRATHDYHSPYFYFDPSDARGLALLNSYMETAEQDMAGTARKHEQKHEHDAKAHPHRGRRFALSFPGNLPPSSVDALVARLPTYFPYSVPYDRTIFSATSSGINSTTALPGTFSAYFQRLHAIHQIVTSPAPDACTSRAIGLPDRLLPPPTASYRLPPASY